MPTTRNRVVPNTNVILVTVLIIIILVSGCKVHNRFQYAHDFSCELNNEYGEI